MLQNIKTIFTKNERIQLIFLLFGILGFGVSESLSVGLLIPLVDVFMQPEKIQKVELLGKLYNWLNASSNTDFMVKLASVIVIFFLLKLIYSLFLIYVRSKLTSNFEIRLSNQVLASYLNKPYKFHLKNNSAILFKNVTTEVQIVCLSFINASLQLLSELVIIICILIFLLIAYPKITLTALLLLILLGGILYKTLQSGMKELSGLRAQYAGEYFKSGMESIEGIKDVKVYNSKDFFQDSYRYSFTKYSRTNIKFQIGQLTPRYFIETILFVSFIGVMAASVYYGYATEELISTMAVMAAASVKIFPSIINISQGITNVRFYSKNVEIVADIIKESENTENESDERLPIHSSHEGIKIEQLSFSYNADNQNVLDDISLEIQPYQSTAFVGESGSGKSTLIDILTGLLIPQKGDIYYGKDKIKPENLYSYRAKIGYVPQQIFLYDDSLMANVAFGIAEQDIDKDRVMQVLRTAQLDKLLAELPQGINTMIGEKGVKLSGGQRQRIGIARALYRNPEVLIFDEATSALDTNTELEVNQAIKKLSKSVTVIIVAHRLNTIKQADFIYLLDNGKIKTKGTFDELTEHSEDFRKIVYAEKIEQ